MSPGTSPYVGFNKDPRGVRNLWERFNAGVLDVEERRSPYQQLLLDEWQRCTALGVDVAMTKGRRLTDQDFTHRRDAEALLVQTSVPIVEDVGRYLVDVPGILILTEGTGTILHITGDPMVRERAASQSGIVEGSQWNEFNAGTNGMGTALSRGQPVHVFATEHFCEGWHTWSCAAAPIFDADGQTVLGVIDFTAVETDFRDQALGLTVSVANSIQARMSLHRELERRRILNAFADTARQYPHDQMLALDHLGRLVTHTPTERCHRIAERWASDTTSRPAARATFEVKAPHSINPIGSIVLLADASPSSARPVRIPSGRSHDELTRFGSFTTGDPDTHALFDDLRRIAASDVTILLNGETGTGKELLARAIHECSPRRQEPYLAVNCGAISEHLMESTFFGYVRGAFSGADPRGRAGYFESAKGGTLFLDEVGELPPSIQTALLRVLEDGSFQRVGSCETRRADCRIVAATHRNLEQMISEGRFRQDLYFRLKVVQRTIKPLRARLDDIRLLTDHFVESMARKHGFDGVRVSDEARLALQRHAWPGNARELRNAIEAAVLCSSSGTVELSSLPPELRSADFRNPTAAAESIASVRDYERRLIISMLKKYRKANHVAGKLGVARSTLYRKFSELDINPKDFTGAGSEPGGSE